MLTNKDLADFCLNKATHVSSKYMWGDYGRTITNTTIDQKAKQYPTRYSAGRIAELKKCTNGYWIGCDCAGLIKWFLWTDKGAHDIRYNSKTDRNTGGLWNCATSRGTIDTLPEVPGIILYKTGHVGVYIGDGNAVECTLGSYGDGIVQSKVSGRGWTHWLTIPDIQYVYDNTDDLPQVGDVVTYTGDLHYTNANAVTGKSCKGGTAKLTQIYKLGQSGHPYHLIYVKGSGATVYGWVDADKVKKINSL